jgi:hypothetical protein
MIPVVRGWTNPDRTDSGLALPSTTNKTMTSTPTVRAHWKIQLHAGSGPGLGKPFRFTATDARRHKSFAARSCLVLSLSEQNLHQRVRARIQMATGVCDVGVRFHVQ